MSTHLLRSALTAALLAVSIPALADTQACDNAPQDYDAGSGTATGLGSSEFRAKKNAGDNAGQETQMAASACDECPDGEECNFSTSWDWDNYQVGTPAWDPILQKWTVSVSWDGCTVTQRCKPCVTTGCCQAH